MNQKLSDWASIAEIVSGVAVVVTLVFLVLGLRENTEITRAAVYDRNIDSLNDWRLTIAENEDLARIYETFVQGDVESLSAEDMRRLNHLANTQWGIYEKSYFSNRYGILGSSEWSRFEEQICRSYALDEDFWREFIEVRLTDEFVSHVLELCVK